MLWMLWHCMLTSCLPPWHFLAGESGLGFVPAVHPKNKCPLTTPQHLANCTCGCAQQKRTFSSWQLNSVCADSTTYGIWGFKHFHLNSCLPKTACTDQASHSGPNNLVTMTLQERPLAKGSSCPHIEICCSSPLTLFFRSEDLPHSNLLEYWSFCHWFSKGTSSKALMLPW